MSKSIPKVSVVIPVYNAEKYLSKCIESIINQTLTDIEIFCVNDGSTDRSGAICDEYANKDCRITVIHKENEGAGSARNAGLAAAKGGFLYFIDSDDSLEINALEYCYEQSVMNSLDIFHFGFFVVQEGQAGSNDLARQKNIQGSAYKTTDPISGTQAFKEMVDENIFYGGVCCDFYRRSLIIKNALRYPSDGSDGEDIKFSVRAFLLSKRVIVDFNKKFYRRLLRKGSVTNTPKLGRVVKANSISIWLEDMAEQETRRIGSVGSEALKAYARHRKQRHLDLKAEFEASGAVEALAVLPVFPPFVEPRAIVTPLRLLQLGSIYGRELVFDVYSANIVNRSITNMEYLEKVAAPASRSIEQIGEYFLGGGDNYVSYSKWSDEVTSKLTKSCQESNYRVLYSSASPQCGHMPAIELKQQFPELFWIAEFSDILTDRITPIDWSSSTSNLHKYVLENTITLADRIIMTCSNQLEFELSNIPNENLRNMLKSKAIILSHPKIPGEYFRYRKTAYTVNEDMINIGYFGLWMPKERKLESLLYLLKNKKAVLHIFMPKSPIDTTAFSSKDFYDALEIKNTRIIVNDVVGPLEMESIALKMDYLYFEDTDYRGPINPFLPSKLSTYLSGIDVILDSSLTLLPNDSISPKSNSCPRILAKVQKGSAADKTEHPSIIKFYEVSEKLINSL